MRHPALVALIATIALVGFRADARAGVDDVQFVHCTPVSPGASEYTCSISSTCSALPCSPEQWLPIAGVQTLPDGFFTPGGTRESAIQITPVQVAGTAYTLVNKDVATQRWAIIQNQTNGVVTGNVFNGGAGGTNVQFIVCSDADDVGDSAVFHDCRLAPPCDAAGCDASDWQAIGGDPAVVASFFSPGAGRASGLQVTPTGAEILISKDLGAQRWTITTLALDTSESFPLGIGPVFGNIFETPVEAATVDSVNRTTANIAFAVYSDALSGAEALRNALEAFVVAPSESSFAAAKVAWIASRETYQQSEIYRFQAGPIDALREDGTLGEDGDGPEGQINSWPLGEALIDYVAPQVDGDAGPESPASVADVDGNIIADAGHFPSLTPEVLGGLNELGGDERNVATGYHAIEFLLWGQDLNADGSPGFGGRDDTPGQRRFTDYLPEGGGCTNGNCTRRGQYLLAATDLLVDDLARVVAAWNPQGGSYYAAFTGGGKISLGKTMEGMGRLAFGELAGERMNIALVTNSQEDEHSCFSDNSHRDFLLDATGIQNVYLGRYVRTGGAVVRGPGPDALLRAQGDVSTADDLAAAYANAVAKLGVVDQLAKAGQPFDNLIQLGINQQDVSGAIQGLVDTIPPLEAAIVKLGVTTGDLCQDTDQFTCEL